MGALPLYVVALVKHRGLLPSLFMRSRCPRAFHGRVASVHQCLLPSLFSFSRPKTDLGYREPSCASALGCFWALPRRFWLDFSPPEVDFGARFWTRNDQTWSHLRRSLRAFGKNVTTTVSVEATPIDAVSSELGVIQGGRRERLTTAWQQQRRKRIIESEITTTM